MRNLIVMAVVMMGLNAVNVMAADKSKTTTTITTTKAGTRQSLPQTVEINVEDVPTIVLNGLNNTYKYEDIIKVEVSSYNNLDIYKFTLLLDNGDTKEVQFSPTGVEI